MRYVLILLLTSTLYAGGRSSRGRSDCRPGRGVPCTSVTDIEAMIVENDNGPDFLIIDPNVAHPPVVPSNSRCACGACKRRVWVPARCVDGKTVPGHYVVLPSAEGGQW